MQKSQMNAIDEIIITTTQIKIRLMIIVTSHSHKGVI